MVQGVSGEAARSMLCRELGFERGSQSAMKIAKRIVALGTVSKQREFFHAPRDVCEVEVACAFAVGQIAS